MTYDNGEVESELTPRRLRLPRSPNGKRTIVPLRNDDALCVAAFKGDTQHVRQLLNRATKHIDPNSRGDGNQTALMFAAMAVSFLEAGFLQLF